MRLAPRIVNFLLTTLDRQLLLLTPPFCVQLWIAPWRSTFLRPSQTEY